LHCIGKIVICAWPAEKTNTNVLKSDSGNSTIQFISYPMEKLITLAVFDSIIDVKFNLLKDMLDQAGISYITNNVNARTVKPLLCMAPANISIDIKVYEKDWKEAMQILKSIE